MVSVFSMRRGCCAVSYNSFMFTRWCKHETNLANMLIAFKVKWYTEQVQDANFACHIGDNAWRRNLQLLTKCLNSERPACLHKGQHLWSAVECRARAIK